MVIFHLAALLAHPAFAGDYDASDDPDQPPRLDAAAAARVDARSDTDRESLTAEPEHECSLSVAPFGTPGHVWMEWTYDQAGFVLPELQVYALDEDGYSYDIRFRVHFGNDEYEWSVNTGPTAAGEVATVYAEIPDDAYMNADQLLYLSDVSVHVVAVAPDGVEAQETGAARVRLAWDTDMTPLLMDVETAESEAPGDAWDPTAPALTGIATLEELRQ